MKIPDSYKHRIAEAQVWELDAPWHSEKALPVSDVETLLDEAYRLGVRDSVYLLNKKRVENLGGPRASFEGCHIENCIFIAHGTNGLTICDTKDSNFQFNVLWLFPPDLGLFGLHFRFSRWLAFHFPRYDLTPTAPLQGLR